MKLAALAFMIVANLAANHACAEVVVPQPLNRLDCVKAGMAWNDIANVCGTPPQKAEAMLESQAGDALGQPLTRSECATAGMTWNDKANVCGEKSAGSAIEAASNGTIPAASTVLVNIDKTRQRMRVFLDGVERYNWPVSTGLPGYSTPSGTYKASSMNQIWYSKQWDNAPMPHAVFFTREGHAIHATNEVKRLGKPASHGCVRISPHNASTLYDLVAKSGLENTRVVLAGFTPGGEGKGVTPAISKSQYNRGLRRSVESYAQPQKRGSFFGRMFGRR